MSIWAHCVRAHSQPPARPGLIAIAAIILAGLPGCAQQPNLPQGATSNDTQLPVPAEVTDSTCADNYRHVGTDAEVAGSASAAPDESAAQTPMPPLRKEDTRKAFWQMLASLTVVLALVVATAAVGKKLLPRLTAQGRRQLRVMETLHVAPRSAVHLMRVGDRVFMLGSTKENLTTLGDVTEAVAAATDAAEGEGDA